MYWHWQGTLPPFLFGHSKCFVSSITEKIETYVFLGIKYWYYICVSKRVSFLFNFTILSWQTPATFRRVLRFKWNEMEDLKVINFDRKSVPKCWAIEGNSNKKHPNCQANMQLRKFQNLILWVNVVLLHDLLLYTHYVLHILHQTESVSIPSL